MPFPAVFPRRSTDHLLLYQSQCQYLVYTIVISVVASCIANAFFNKEKSSIVVEDDKFVRQKFTINANVILGALGMVCLNIGSNISFGGITAGMATGGNYNVDNLTVISSWPICFLPFSEEPRLRQSFPQLPMHRTLYGLVSS